MSKLFLRRCIVLVVLTISVAIPVWAAADDFDLRTALFKYDNKVDLGVKEVAAEKRGDVTIRDISFVGIAGKPSIKAYLVIPNGAGSFAGVLWVHWLGEEKSNRDQFLDEAVALAPKGVVSLIVDAMWATPKWFEDRILERDYEDSIEQVIKLRRAMDLLTGQPNVDKTRIGFVGHDYGGMYGMLMAGVDQRARTYVFIAVTQSFEAWAFLAKQPVSKAEYLRRNSVLELTDYLRQVKNSSTLFQFGTNDFFVSGADAAIIFAAANQPKERKRYDTGHKMDLPKIVSDRDDWLVRQLNLTDK